MNDERTLQEAARQRARLLAHDCTDAEREQMQAWQARSPANRRAAALAERVVTDIERLGSDERLQSKLRALADEALAARGVAPAVEQAAERDARQQRRRVFVGLAASAVMCMLAWQLSPRIMSTEAEPLVYETGAQERRSVTLEDGSVVELDVKTRVAVRMSAQRRQIELTMGRALFDVAHDSSRPFTVTADGSRTTALGTQFQVQRDASRVIVTLAEGSVAVDRVADRDGAVWQERLTPGEQLSIDSASTRRSRHFVDPQIVTSWTHGRHVFRGTPLQEALDEVNRYAARKVRLGDPSLADLRVAGNFIAGDSEVVVDAFAAVLPLRVVESDSEIILFQRYGD